MDDHRPTNPRQRPAALDAGPRRRGAPTPTVLSIAALLTACQFDSNGFGSAGPEAPGTSSTGTTSSAASGGISSMTSAHGSAGDPQADAGSFGATGSATAAGSASDTTTASSVTDPTGIDPTGTETSTGPCALQAWYPDIDADGFGGPGPEVMACEAPDGHVPNADDCDDTNAAINPEALELCNEADDDCDEITDEGSTSNESCGGCEFLLAADGTRFFALCEDAATRDVARSWCLEDFGPDAELARIDSDIDQQELLARIDSDHWIGLDDLAAEGTWRWHDGSLAYMDEAAVGYDGWRPGQPISDNGERCGELDPAGWADANCSQSQLRICEHPP